MRKFLLIVLVVALIVAAIGGYLVWSTPSEPRGVKFPPAADQRALLARVPASAEAFALVPTAAAVYGRLQSNPVTREPIEEWSAKQKLPPPWMMGSADLVAWKSGKQISYAVRLDPLRAALVRIYMMLGADMDAQVAQSTFVINAAPGAPIGGPELDELMALGDGLPGGDALLVQRRTSRGAFPPIARPAVTVVKVTAEAIDLTSQSGGPRPSAAPAPPERPLGAAALHRVRFPQNALMTVAFADPPRAIGDLDRVVGRKVSALLRDGGAIAVYDIETGTLLPRPREVIILPADDARRQALREFVDDLLPRTVQDALGFKVETHDTGSELLVAFERATIELYLKDAFAAPRFPATEWSARIDPKRSAPALQRVTESAGLRLVAPRLFRSARDLDGWMRYLQNAKSIEAAASAAAGKEQLRVHVASK